VTPPKEPVVKKQAAPVDPSRDDVRPDRFAGVPQMRFDDDDERPSREDRSYGETIFTRPVVPLPRWLRGRRRRER
jgi:hypothetical protein